MKWELDLWYELWERAGSQGLDTWYDPRVVRGEGSPPRPASEAGDGTDGEPEGS